MRGWALGILLALALPVRAGDALHWVARGETAWRIARMYGVPVAEVLRANGLGERGEGLRAGVWLRIPGGVRTPLPPGVYAVWNRWGRTGPDFVGRSLGVSPGEVRRLSGRFRSATNWLLVSPAGEHLYLPAERALTAARWRGVRAEELRALAGDRRERWLVPAGRLLFRWPVAGRLTSGYGPRDLWVAGSNFHRGIDLAAPRGTWVRAPRGGVVVRAGWDRWLGWYVRLDHGDGWETVYGHLERLAVRRGERVRTGDPLGQVGASGRGAYGVHLHFEVRRDGRSVDPLYHLPSSRPRGGGR